MKKILYGLLMLCLMFFGIINVNAKGDIYLSEYTLTIEEGESKTFNIVTDNVIASGTIASSDSNIITIDNIDDSDSWITDMDGKGVIKNESFTIRAVGAVGSTANVIVTIKDAVTYDDEEIVSPIGEPKVEVLRVKIVAKSVESDLEQYTVSYDMNGGNNDGPNSQTKTEGKDLVLSSIKPTKDGYSFVGWNTKADGTGTSYSAGGKYTTDSNITLYAMWKSVANPDVNPDTGDSSILIILAIVITFGIYSYWYTKKSRES